MEYHGRILEFHENYNVLGYNLQTEKFYKVLISNIAVMVPYVNTCGRIQIIVDNDGEILTKRLPLMNCDDKNYTIIEQNKIDDMITMVNAYREYRK